MLYLTTTPEGRSFFYHFPTHTLCEAFFNAGAKAVPPRGTQRTHHLRGHQPEGEIPTEALLAIADWMEATRPGGSSAMTSMSSGPGKDLPEHIVFGSESDPKSLLIHYPAFGFTAGIREDGTKIPPHWRNPDLFTPEQRSHFLAQAAESLMQAVAAFMPKGQVA